MSTQDALEALRAPTDLAILRLTEPIYDPHDNNRASNASSASSQATHDPEILKADLQHYRDLFAKLRFSYVEQVTKEKFLRAVTADAPELVSHEANAQLEAENSVRKQLLVEKKDELSGMLSDLEAQSRELARRYNVVELQTTQLEAIPVEMEEMRSQIASLRAQQRPQSDSPDLRLPLRESTDLLQQRTLESAALDAQIESMQAMLSGKQQHVVDAQNELDSLDKRRQSAAQYIQDARSRQDGGDEQAELQLRWLRGVEASMRAMLQT